MRAFVKDSGMSVSDPALWAKWRSLSDEDKAALEERGRMGTAVHRMGLPSFGGRSRVRS